MASRSEDRRFNSLTLCTTYRKDEIRAEGEQKDSTNCSQDRHQTLRHRLVWHRARPRLVTRRQKMRSYLSINIFKYIVRRCPRPRPFKYLPEGRWHARLCKAWLPKRWNGRRPDLSASFEHRRDHVHPFRRRFLRISDPRKARTACRDLAALLSGEH